MYKPEYRWRYNEKHRERELERCRRKARQQLKRRDPVKEKARAAVRNAVVAGRIVKPEHCPQCGEAAVVHAHHHDYSQPFVFDWLCSRCHGKAHRQALATFPQDGA